MSPTEWALALSLASVALSLLALWRSSRQHALGLRTELRREVAELLVTMDELVGRINRALQSASEHSIDAATLQALRREADMDSVQLEALRGRLNELSVIRPLSSYKSLEAKSALARALRTRVGQLADKYPCHAVPLGGSSHPVVDAQGWRAATTRQ